MVVMVLNYDFKLCANLETESSGRDKIQNQTGTGFGKQIEATRTEAVTSETQRSQRCCDKGDILYSRHSRKALEVYKQNNNVI